MASPALTATIPALFTLIALSGYPMYLEVFRSALPQGLSHSGARDPRPLGMELCYGMAMHQEMGAASASNSMAAMQ